jgi:23S rRNA (adenine2503-C2)-methyltransferase
VQIAAIRARLRALGALPLHEQRDWVQAAPHERGGRPAAVDALILPTNS